MQSAPTNRRSNEQRHNREKRREVQTLNVTGFATAMWEKAGNPPASNALPAPLAMRLELLLRMFPVGSMCSNCSAGQALALVEANEKEP